MRQHLGCLSDGPIPEMLHVLPHVKTQKDLPLLAARAGNAGRGTMAQRWEGLPQSHTKTLAVLEATSVFFISYLLQYCSRHDKQ